MSPWKNKVVLVTGGSAGLGRAIAEAFAASGAGVVLAARESGKLQAAARAMRERGLDVMAIGADVTRQEDVDTLLVRTLEHHGRLDVLVNCAGRSTRGEVLATTPEQFAELLELNFLGAVRCVRAAVPHLLKTTGHIVNIGSLASKVVSPFLGAYPAGKFALAAYSQQLRLELGPQGVHVLLVCPGPIARQDAGRRYDESAGALPGSARQPGGGVKLKGIPPERLARQIVRACQRRRAELIMPAKARLLFALAQLWPSLGDWIIRRMTR